MLAAAAFTGLYAYIDRTPAVRAKLEVCAKLAEDRVDADDGFLTKLSALAASWWEADAVVAEDAKEEALKKKADAQERAEAESRRFNDSHNSYGDNDYYPARN